VTLKMRLSLPENVQLFVGTDKNKLSFKKKSSAPALDHELTIDSLSANTNYYYSVQIGNNTVELDSN